MLKTRSRWRWSMQAQTDGDECTAFDIRIRHGVLYGRLKYPKSSTLPIDGQTTMFLNLYIMSMHRQWILQMLLHANVEPHLEASVHSGNERQKYTTHSPQWQSTIIVGLFIHTTFSVLFFTGWSVFIAIMPATGTYQIYQRPG